MLLLYDNQNIRKEKHETIFKLFLTIRKTDI